MISVDFELRWGMHDLFGLDFGGYREELVGGRDVVPALIERFVARNLRVTWASVGAIGCASWDDYWARAPRAPDYANETLRIRPEYADLDPDGELHFAPELLDAIVAAPGQELGTHTFSHLFLREPGITADDVTADLAAVNELHVARYGTPPTSLVFPRNQHAFIDAVRSAGIRIWRGNPAAWYYECESESDNRALPRALKLLDSVNPLRRLAAPLSGDMTRASMFLRFNLPSPLWKTHVARIRAEIAALGAGEIFHAWFHPHNLGRSREARLGRLEEVLDIIGEHHARNTAQSCSMADLAVPQPV